MKQLFYLISVLGCYGILVSCTLGDPEPKATTDALQTFNLTTNSEGHQKKPYVVLVSIDGYRWDYNQLHKPPHLTEIEKSGAAAKSLAPVFPSKTFPNHYSIVTGLYSDRHGIVGNEFYDPESEKTYAMYDRSAVRDGKWYGGVPLWEMIQKEGLLTASFFWVGSEAPINENHPNYFYYYDGDIEPAARVEQVINWFQLPEAKRPHFITLYFDQVDSAGHRFGPNSRETKEAVQLVDKELGKLLKAFKDLEFPVNLIVVSDHGMAQIDPTKVIVIDESSHLKNLFEKFKVVGSGTQMSLFLKPGQGGKNIQILERALEKEAKNFQVLNKKELGDLNYDSSPRVGDLVLVAKAPWLLAFSGKPPKPAGGGHGWDANESKDMHGVLFATGPGFKSGAKISSVENIHVYPMVLNLFGIEPPSDIDGRGDVTKGLMKSP